MTATRQPTPVRVELLGRFSCAVHDRPLLRTFVAASLWLDCNEQRATANLRSALWRLSSHADRFVVSDRTSVALDDTVGVDVRTLSSVAYGLVNGDRPLCAEPGSATASPAETDGVHQLRLLSNDLLPDWYDDWLVLERERLRQLRLNALDRLSAALLTAGSPALAMDAAYLSIEAEPLRESAHRALITALLAAGNRWEALRQYDRFRDLLGDALGLAPSAELQRMVDDAVHPRR
jgi:DNA-binding SARP family transcriptional activator